MYKIEIENTVLKFDTIDGFSVERDPGVIQAEETALVQQEVARIQALVDSYIAAQQYQLTHGGPGPVAEFEIMKIVNEYAGEFEVVFKEE